MDIYIIIMFTGSHVCMHTIQVKPNHVTHSVGIAFRFQTTTNLKRTHLVTLCTYTAQEWTSLANLSMQPTVYKINRILS